MPAHRDRSYPKGDVPKSGAADNRRDALVRAAAELTTLVTAAIRFWSDGWGSGPEGYG